MRAIRAMAVLEPKFEMETPSLVQGKFLSIGIEVSGLKAGLIRVLCREGNLSSAYRGSALRAQQFKLSTSSSALLAHPTQAPHNSSQQKYSSSASAGDCAGYGAYTQIPRRLNPSPSRRDSGRAPKGRDIQDQLHCSTLRFFGVMSMGLTNAGLTTIS